MISLFKQPVESEVLKDLFQKERDKRSLVYESINIETSFGNTSVLVIGKEDLPPLVFIYGVSGCPPFSLDLLISLKEHYRIYSIDGLEYSAVNEESALSLEDESYGQWMYEVLAWLNIRNATMIGVSFGGFVCCKTLLFDQRHISKAFLVVPEGIVSSCTWRTVWSIKLPLTFYKWCKHPCIARQISKALITDHKEDHIAFFSKWMFYADTSVVHVPTINQHEAKRIETPVFLIASERDILFPGKSLIRQAEDLFPSLADVLLLKHAKHILDKSAHDQIVDFVIGRT